MKRSESRNRGELVASLLYQSWRADAPTCSVSAEALAEVEPLLVVGGSAGLVWRGIRGSELEEYEAALRLRQVYRHQVILSAVREREIAAAVRAIRTAGVEPLLGKGWAASRYYQETGLRPYGDADLYTSPEEYSRAAAVLDSEAPGCWVDLHKGLGDLDDLCFEMVFGRSTLAPLGEGHVRVFGEEDHLRLLCLHAMRHGACRPLWFCDIGAAIESRTERFDWDRFLRSGDSRSDAVLLAVALAHRLLGADITGTPLLERVGSLPAWMIPSVLIEWGTLRTPHGLRQPMSTCLRQIRTAIDQLRSRWPNAVEATVAVGGPFNEWPRLPFKIAASAARTLGFAFQLSRAIGARCSLIFMDNS